MRGPEIFRASMEGLLRDHWERRAGVGVESSPGTSTLLSLILAPPSALYRMAVSVRNLAYDQGWLSVEHPAVPVVSVGNVVVGGSGKTPVTAWIIALLSDAGYRPAVLTRGYGRDEVALHRRWNPEIPVYVDGDRVRAASTARREDRDCVVLDDGFQHRRIARDLDIVLHPVEVPLESRVLPAGPFREPLNSLARADFILLTSKTAEGSRVSAARAELARRHPDVPVGSIRLRPAGWTDLSGAPADPPTGPLLAVTGIARPRTFAEMARTVTGGRVDLEAFPDHHDFSQEELDDLAERAGDRILILTEKDAIRVLESGRSLGHPVRVLRLAVEEDEGCDLLRRLLADAASESREPDEGSTFSKGEATGG